MITTEPNRIRVVNSAGVCIAFAIRGRQGNLWWVHERDRKDRFRTVARISGKIPEQWQRRIVLSILKEYT